MLSPFIDSSVDNVQPVTFEFIDIPKQRLIDSLLHDTANTVSKRTEVTAVGDHRSGEMKNLLTFFVYFNAYFAYSGFCR